jgi:hypothetical protein
VPTKKTGNPVGRPKGAVNLATRDMKAKAQTMAGDVLDTYFAILKDAQAPPAERIKAGDRIMDRAYGKVAQQIKTTDTSARYDLRKVPIEKLRMVADTLRLAQRDGVVIDHE